MSTPLVFIIALVVAVDAVVVGALVYVIRTQVWGPLVKAFPMGEPPAEPGPIAWFAKLDMWNAGLTFRVSADESYLYLTPAVLGVALRLSPVSIPWDRVEVRKVGKRSVTLRAEKIELTVPRAGLDPVLAGKAAS